MLSSNSKPLVQAYFKAYPWLAKLPIKTGLITGIALGLFNREDFHYLDELNAGRTGKWASESHNLRGLLDWEERALEAWFPSKGRLLLTAAGGGREALALEPRGYEVSASECNPDLVEAANRHLKKHGLETRINHCPRDESPKLAGKFDGAIVGWGSYTLIAPRDRRVRLLMDLAAHLPEDGPLLLSYFKMEGAPGLVDRVQRTTANIIRHLRRKAPVDAGDVMDWNFRHRFTAEEIRDELSEAGLDPVMVSDDGYPHAIGIKRKQLQQAEIQYQDGLAQVG